MKIKLSKSQWESIGKTAGWMKISQSKQLDSVNVLRILGDIFHYNKWVSGEPEMPLDYMPYDGYKDKKNEVYFFQESVSSKIRGSGVQLFIDASEYKNGKWIVIVAWRQKDLGYSHRISDETKYYKEFSEETDALSHLNSVENQIDSAINII